MEAEQIGVVLARASELRSKVSISMIDSANRRSMDGGVTQSSGEVAGEEFVEEEEGKSLVHIRDALASLEQQLASLQNLQQQQLYERESTLAQIDRTRKLLLQELKEYKGEELELIHEAATFAGETIKQDDDLLLPPYPRDFNDSLVLDDLYSSSFVTKHSDVRNGLASTSASKLKNSIDDPDDASENHVGSASGNRWGPLKLVAGIVAKSAVTILSGIALMSLAGYETKLGRNGIHFRASDLTRGSSDRENNQAQLHCPPGKFLVVENGEARCVVKERIEIPFDSNVTAPNLRYGFG